MDRSLDGQGKFPCFLLEPSREPRSRAPERPVSGHMRLLALTVSVGWNPGSGLETADVSSRPNWMTFSFSSPKTTLH
jgi:hypothetical protein